MIDNESLLLREPARWLAHIAARTAPPNADGCELFLRRGGGLPKNYGQIRAYGRIMRAHRGRLTLALGKPMGKRWALHTCDNRACVAIAHLYAGDVQRNNADRNERHPAYVHSGQWAQAAALRAQGLSMRAIGRRMGIDSGAVSRGLRRTSPGLPSFAAPHPRSITPAEWRCAYLLRQSGMSYYAIAKASGKSATGISDGLRQAKGATPLC